MRSTSLACGFYTLAFLSCLSSTTGCSSGGGASTDPADGGIVDGGGGGDGSAASEAGSASDGGVEGGSDASGGDGGAGPVCGNATCASNELCLVSCASGSSQSPYYCSAIPEGGACPLEHPQDPSCLGGTGVDAGSPGCSLATYTYTCRARTPGQTSFDCSRVFPQWANTPIVNGVATCCED